MSTVYLWRVTAQGRAAVSLAREYPESLPPEEYPGNILTYNQVYFPEVYCETQISKTNNLNTLNNLKVTIGELKIVSRSEPQISEAQRTDNCWTNYPIVNKLLGTIPQSGGCNTPQLAAEFVSKACFGGSYP